MPAPIIVPTILLSAVVKPDLILTIRQVSPQNQGENNISQTDTVVHIFEDEHYSICYYENSSYNTIIGKVTRIACGYSAAEGFIAVSVAPTLTDLYREVYSGTVIVPISNIQDAEEVIPVPPPLNE